MDKAELADLRIEQSPKTLREIAVERLRGAIVAGRFASGERLIERTLCNQLGVSRTVVREAIRYLEAEGLVEITRSGPIVVTLDWHSARQIYNIRLLLETEAAADCARRIGAGQKQDLKRALHSIQASFSAQQPQSLYDATTEFYRVIFSAAGPDVAWESVQRLNGRISRLRALTLATTDRSVSGPARMARICEAIVAGDPDAAAKAVHEHLTEAAEIARRLLNGELPLGASSR